MSTRDPQIGDVIVVGGGFVGSVADHANVALERDSYRAALKQIRSYCPNQPTGHPADAAFDRIIAVCHQVLQNDESRPEGRLSKRTVKASG